MPALALKNVNQVFGTGTARVQVLHDVNFAVEPGTLSLIVGPSGSGKSTFLSIAGGLLTPTSGSVWLDGVSYHDRTKKQRDQLRLQSIGFVLQAYHLLPYLNVDDQFKLVDHVKPKGNLDAKQLGELLDELGIADLRKKFPGELSGGQQQRVAIARALYPDPSVILADEPTAALDSARVEVVGALFQALAHARGKAVVVVTHDVRLEKFADQIFAIEDGVLHQVNK
ncbi:ABC transporter ATP-binding protein [Lacticaseibacillus hulanensis]|uniref:ABC transporter ATP-binding protein n=1 Tax=Lacticaseibacillus hulanensis TaxID=2493111 RepID=UPI000FD88D20|nr:ABC transporter ATP-binding protein [Lacticaseibacillus hulanensis]